MDDSDGLRVYRRARIAFSAKVYGLLILWLFLAIIQWIVVNLVEDLRSNVGKYYYISLIAFVLAILLFAIFIFADGLRFLQCLNFIISLIIVELQIIATFILVALSWWAEVIVFFVVCAVLIFIFLLIGIVLPRRMDLTLDIAVLFIIAFIFLVIAVFAFTLLMNLWFPKVYTYLTVELAVTLTILLFVIYHAQTIHGNRFAEMRLNDFFLGSLILFHDFLIIYWLTFYWQIHYRPFTPDSWMESSVAPNKVLELNDLPKNWRGYPGGGVFTEPSWGSGTRQEYGVTEPGSKDDQDEDSTQNRQDTNKWRSQGRSSLRRLNVNRGNHRNNPKQHVSRTTAIDWSVFKSQTIGSHETQDEPVQNIQRKFEALTDYRGPGVLYKLRPFYGSNVPARAHKTMATDEDRHLGSESEGARGKPKAGFGKSSLVSSKPSAYNNWDDVSYVEDVYGHLNENKTAADELNELNRTAQRKEKSAASLRAEPLSTTKSSLDQVPGSQKLVMNDTSDLK